MKENFVDECKDRVFNTLLDNKGESFGDKYELADVIASLISNDVIYSSEGESAIKMYLDAFDDFWDCEGYRYKDMRDFNPYSPTVVLDVWRDMVSYSCSTIMMGITEKFPDLPITLGKKELMELSIGLDGFEEYPFLVKGFIQYDYFPEKRSFYLEAIAKLDGPSFDHIKEVGETIESTPISTAMERKNEDGSKKNLSHKAVSLSKSKKGRVKL